MVIPLVILYTLRRFIECVAPKHTEREPIESVLAEAIAEMGKLTHEAVSPDSEFDAGSGSVHNNSLSSL